MAPGEGFVDEDEPATVKFAQVFRCTGEHANAVPHGGQEVAQQLRVERIAQQQSDRRARAHVVRNHGA